MKCLVPQCKNAEHNRGLCKGHLKYAKTLVKQHKTTWDSMVRRGKAMKPAAGAGPLFGWFMAGAEPEPDQTPAAQTPAVP